jgi:hypothetical protein
MVSPAQDDGTPARCTPPASDCPAKHVGNTVAHALFGLHVPDHATALYSLLLKPAQHTPASCMWMEALLDEAGTQVVAAGWNGLTC